MRGILGVEREETPNDEADRELYLDALEVWLRG
jgi:hypothetical protein